MSPRIEIVARTFIGVIVVQAPLQCCKRRRRGKTECAIAFAVHGSSAHHDPMLFFSVPKVIKKKALCTFIMNRGLSCHHNTSIIQRERSMPVLPWKACNLTQNAASPLFFYIVASFLVSIGHIYMYSCSHYYFHRSFIGGGRSSLSQFFVLYFSLCSIISWRRSLLKKFDKVLDFFFQNSIVCREFF